MARCTACGKEITNGEYCAPCQSKFFFDDSDSALPDCFDWEIPQPDQAPKPAARKTR